MAVVGASKDSVGLKSEDKDKLVLEDPRRQGLSSRTTTLQNYNVVDDVDEADNGNQSQ